MPKTIDLTPLGLTTPEGVKRNRRAVQALDSATADLCNMLMQTMETPCSLEDSLRKLGLDKDETDDVLQAVKRRRDATEEFLRSLCGAAPVKNT